MFKCCPTPFTQTNISTRIDNCLSCQKKYKVTKQYICPKCNKSQGCLTMYNLYKDGRTDWSTCNHCDYDEFPVTEFILKDKVTYY